MTIAQRSRAHDMIEAKGQSVTIYHAGASTYNPATGVNTQTPPLTQTGKGVILPFASGLRKMAGTNIPATDRQCLLSGLNSAGAVLTAPKVDGTLTDAASQVYTITEVSPLAPAGLSIIYELTIRGNA